MYLYICIYIYIYRYINVLDQEAHILATERKKRRWRKKIREKSVISTVAEVESTRGSASVKPNTGLTTFFCSCDEPGKRQWVEGRKEGRKEEKERKRKEGRKE